MKEEKNPQMEMASQAMRGYENAFQSGLKFLDETWRSCMPMFSQTTQAIGAQKQFSGITELVERIPPMAKKSMEEASELMEKTSQTSAELMKKAASAAQATEYLESQTRWFDFFKLSLQATRANADSIMRLNTHIMDLWIDFFAESIRFPLSHIETGTTTARAKV